MDRRTFIKRGLLGGSLLALGGVGLALYPGRDSALPTEPLRWLEPRPFRALVAFAARVVTAAGRDPIAIAQGVDQLLVAAPVETRSDLNKLLGLLDNALGALLLDGRLTPFSRLDDKAQDHALTQWRDSRLAVRRTGYQALRKLCLATHYAGEASWAALGYAPPTGLNAMAYGDSKAGTPEWLDALKQGGG